MINYFTTHPLYLYSMPLQPLDCCLMMCNLILYTHSCSRVRRPALRIKMEPTKTMLLIFMGFASVCETKQPLIVFLMDGFRHDYIEKFPQSTPNLRRFMENGVRAKHMEPVHPSNTYPNMYSIATGRDPECHQMFDNIMYDRPHNEWFLMHPHPNASHSFWYEGSEPLWVTAVKNGKKVAMYYWFGCEVEILGFKPTYCQKPTQFYYTPVDVMVNNYTESIEDGLRKTKYENYDMIWLYLEYTDFIGHHGGGPESDNMKFAVGVADQILSILLTKLDNYNLAENTNVILISDHGMAQTTPGTVKIVTLENAVQFSDAEYVMGLGSSAGILPLPGKIDEVYDFLKIQNIEGIDVYKYDEIPEYFRMKHAQRLQGWIYILAKPGYYIKKILNPVFEEVAPNIPADFDGIHGYDIDKFEDMRAIFLAKGPAFQINRRIDPIKNLDLYNLMSLLIGVKPLPNNGNVHALVNSATLKPQAIKEILSQFLRRQWGSVQRRILKMIRELKLKLLKCY